MLLNYFYCSSHHRYKLTFPPAADVQTPSRA